MLKQEENIIFFNIFFNFNLNIFFNIFFNLKNKKTNYLYKKFLLNINLNLLKKYTSNTTIYLNKDYNYYNKLLTNVKKQCNFDIKENFFEFKNFYKVNNFSYNYSLKFKINVFKVIEKKLSILYKNFLYYLFFKKAKNAFYITVTNNFGEVISSFTTGQIVYIKTKKEKKTFKNFFFLIRKLLIKNLLKKNINNIQNLYLNNIFSNGIIQYAVNFLSLNRIFINKVIFITPTRHSNKKSFKPRKIRRL